MQIDDKLVQKLIQDQFPQWSNLAIKPVARSGWDNRTFRLGDELLVRLPSAESYAAQVPKEQKWLPFLNDRISTQIPQVVALGMPGHGFLWSWSIYSWIDGTDLPPDISDTSGIARSVSNFILELHSVESSDGPAPGLHNYFRGGDLGEYDSEVTEYARLLANEIDADAALVVWSKALESNWDSSPVWIHGDLEPSNILITKNKSVAVIDFGNCAIGDPACDLVMAWTFFDDSARQVFRAALQIDNNTWERARAWALWKAMFRMATSLNSDDVEFTNAKRLVKSILADTL